MRRLPSIDRPVLRLTFPPRYTNSFVWLYSWPAASTLNVAVDSGIPFVRKHMSCDLIAVAMALALRLGLSVEASYDMISRS